MRIITFLAVLALSVAAVSESYTPVPQGHEQIKLYVRGDSNSRYMMQLLEEMGYELTFETAQSDADGLIEEVLNGTVDVVWSAPTQKLKSRLHRIDYDVFDGLLGMRICLVPHGKPPLNLEKDLHDIVFGSGTHWRDTEILESAGLKVKKGGYKELFGMTERGEVDCYPRGLHEPWSELSERWTLKGIKINFERDYIIAYDNEFNFFMRPGDPRLDHVQDNIALAVNNVLPTTTQYLQAKKNAGLGTRTVIKIKPLEF